MELWEQTFSCKWLDQEKFHALMANGTMKACTGEEKLESLMMELEHRVSLHVYTAVYAIAWALHNMLYCTHGYGALHAGTCATISSFYPWQLLHYVRNVNFKTKDGSHVFFDANGNPPAMYDIVNWRVSANSSLEKVTVGRFDVNSPDGTIFNVYGAEMIWINHTQLSSHLQLIFIDPNYYGILGVFICYKKTPIVRANNYFLSCLLLFSLFLCFLCSLGFIGYPQPEKCLLRQVAFGMTFTFCISCVLAKTITVVIAFNATKPGSRLKRWTGVKVSYCVLLVCTLIQTFLCVMWLILSPPFPEFETDKKPGAIIINCNEGSSIAFWCMLGYLGLLATISFIVAFLARRLPDSFNETKFITFSMLAFLSVWVSFIPAYLSARGMYTVAMEVFAIMSSSLAVVICIFLPKCFIVLFRPKLNSREHLMGKSRGKK
ncbi:vomeronasal type-2 receptor 26-like [Xenopus laevis]|uniref:Vomeronasal type-2 receptor 26-like n=1 Tax=Xenopus laevis TaxID=8355 RepID=A0A8J1MIN5_XENLA|nr:vomeronasal type-2 receptor 26-like [Xenopus laevis]